MESIPECDELILEYLIFRGYFRSYKSFSAEKNSESSIQPYPFLVCNQLIECIMNSKLTAFQTLWSNLNKIFFNSITENEEIFQQIQQMETILLQLLLIMAYQNSRKEVIEDFFKKNGDQLYQKDNWNNWFSLLFINNPENHPFFEQYFQKSYFNAVTASLHNLIQTIFKDIPLPKILAFGIERERVKTLKNQISLYQEQLSQLNIDQQKQQQHSLSLQSRDDLLKEIKNPILSQCIYSGHNHEISCVRFSHDGQYIATASLDGLIRIWPSIKAIFPTMEPVQSFSSLRSLSPQNISSPSINHNLSPSPDLLKANIHKTTSSSNPFSQDSKHFNNKIISSDIISKLRRIYHKYLKRQSQMETFHFITNPLSPFLTLEFDPKHESLLLSGTSDGKIYLHNHPSLKVISEIILPQPSPYILSIASHPLENIFVSAICHPSNNNDQGTLLCYDISKGIQTQTYQLETIPLSICFNHNGNMLAVAGYDGFIRIYDIMSSHPIMSWKAHDQPISSLKFGKAETAVLSAGYDGKIIEYSLYQNQKCLNQYNFISLSSDTLPLHHSELCLNNANHFMISSPYHHHIWIYHVDYPNPIEVISGHCAPVLSIDWNQMNQCVTGSLDGSTIIRNLHKFE